MARQFNTLLQTIQHYKLFPPQTTVLIAVSGGADSLALLHWLANHRAQLQINLHVATLNHGIRASAQGDVNFVKAMAEAWQVPVTSAMRDVPVHAQANKLSLEDAARQIRYQFLAETAHQVGATHVVTAHHADDQSETILMHILRGAGLNGLRGMALISNMPNDATLQLVRPLLTTSRAEIEAYCEENDLQPRIDHTNFDTSYRRNEIRLEILPRLRQINPQLDDALARLADIASTETDYLTQNYQQYFKPKAKFTDRVTIDLREIQSWHIAMQRRFIVDALAYLDTEPQFNHIQHAITLIERGQVGAIAEFKGNTRLRIDYDTLNLEPIDLALPMESFVQLVGEVELLIPGETVVGKYKIIASYNPLPNANAQLTISEGEQVKLRTRCAGDTFAPQGLSGHRQKIKKWLINNKIPIFVRDGLPLVIIRNIIVAIVLPNQWRLAETLEIPETSQRIIHFKVVKL
ncbi:MAG: tRNA lysidine(34) synthetase TilS [Chloroflexota bacterium]